MLSSAVRRFTDPDEFATHVRAATAEFAITKPGRFAGRLIRIDLHRLWLQRFTQSLPTVAHFEMVSDRAFISLPARAGPSINWSGKDQQSDTLLRHPRSRAGFQRTAGPTTYGIMSLPIADLEAFGVAVYGYDFAPPKEPLAVVPPSAALERLQSLHAAAGLLAEHAPEVIVCPEAARGLEQALIAAMADCLAAPGDDRSSKLRNDHHGEILERFYAILRANSDRVLHLPEMCKAVGASNRTLTTCCHEALGMSPHRYLKLRQLNLARRALVLGEPATTTVTRVATEYGFWDLGRFAMAYRAIFGVRPSVTLGGGRSTTRESSFPIK